ncbi:FAD binding domain-containing protein [Annulohypoxylon nitens]|nr:FAD binding domain-containing protein [Annulohypoxylon nitens]
MSDIIIVGAGPTGLWLALELRSAGLEVTVIEKNATRDVRSRAAAMAAGSLETFATRGLEQRFIDAGKPIHSVHFGSHPTRLQMSRETLGVKNPHSLMIAQAITEQLLVDIAEERGVNFLFGHRAIGLVQDVDGVTLEVEAEDGKNSKLTAPWLIGCDGTKSVVRNLSNFEYPGTNGFITGWLVDVLVTDPPPHPMSVTNESGAFLVQPLGYKDYYRVTGVDTKTMGLPPSAVPTLEDAKEFAIQGVGTDFGMHSPLWASRFSNTTRLATNFRDGRVFIAGDAAHQFFPAGGQGITTGLQDASNLAWKLAAVATGRITGTNAENLLNSYSTERRCALELIIKSTLAQTALLTADTRPLASLSEIFYELLGHPELNKMWVRRITGFGDRFPVKEEGQDPLIGARVTHLEIQGGFEALHSAMAVDKFLLVVIDASLEGALREHTGPWVAHIKYFGPSDNINAFGSQWDDVDAALIRPDARVAWIWRSSFPNEQLGASISKVLGDLCEEV